MKKEKGITLIALVITIIVLLILAGVSVAMLTGTNGILTQASNSKQATEASTEKEKRQLSQVEASTHLENYDYTDAEGNTAKIPAGFAVSNVEGENLVNKGLVIIGITGNEYVWIPCTEETYKREESNWKISDEALKDELTLAAVEPSEEEKDNGITTMVLNEIVEQIKSEKNSIKNNGGYYIGRYETGKENGKAVVKQNQKPYASIIWSKVYDCAKEIETGVGATSYLCSSYAWDTAVKFIQTYSGFNDYAISRDRCNENWEDVEVKDKNGNIVKKVHEVSWLKTGITTAVANIYDMGGNVAEFTTEIKPNTERPIVLRGGNYHNVWSPAGYRWDALVDGAYKSFGFRTTLFLKN